MTEQQVNELKDWAINFVAWEDAYAKALGKKMRPIKGVRKMRLKVDEALADRTKTPQARGAEAAGVITEAILETWPRLKTAA